LWIIEPDRWDAERIIADLAEIRRYNPQRLEMELLTAVVYEDTDRHICAGYKDLAMDEFWARSYLPQSPIMPGTAMCEAAAQLATYYVLKHRLYTSPGCLAGLTSVRCRGVARPGQRLFVMARLPRIHGNLLTCQFQCAVRKRLVCDGVLTGAVFERKRMSSRYSATGVTWNH
jgi:3-hydroxyacyl-[acyl-carrier-protein] dehydratase